MSSSFPSSTTPRPATRARADLVRRLSDLEVKVDQLEIVSMVTDMLHLGITAFVLGSASVEEQRKALASLRDTTDIPDGIAKIYLGLLDEAERLADLYRASGHLPLLRLQ